MPSKAALRPLSWAITPLLTLFFMVAITATTYAASNAPSAIYLPLLNSPAALPPSEQLIETARQGGKLDDETALLYRVYANFADPRLPAEYHGDDSNVGPNLAIMEAQARFAKLSPQTQGLLAPFLLPPTAEGSWLEESAVVAQAAGNAPNAADAKITWHTTCQTDPNIKVWYQDRYPEDAAGAAQVCELVHGEIWPRLKSLMGRNPLDDGAESNNGGDNELDLYLVNANTGALGYRGCFNTPSYIYVNRTRWNKALLTEAVMGAFLNSYPAADCMEYLWLYAATTAWSIDHVYPQDNWEHYYADGFLHHTDMPLDSYPVVPLDKYNKNGEGAYLWVWYAANLLKSPKETVPLWWQAATNPDSLAAVNGVMGDQGFDTQWKDFSGLNWNHEPVDNYKALDDMPYSSEPAMEEKVTLNGASDRTYELDAEIPYLAARTYHFTFNDPNIRSVLFYNPFKDGSFPNADVMAYYQLEDKSWHVENWTNQYGKGFCRDLEAERVQDLVVVISNHEWKNRNLTLEPAKPPRLNVTNVACRGWEFEGKATWVGTGDQYSRNDSGTVKATFLRQPYGDGSGTYAIDMFQVAPGTGSGSWSHSGHSANCSGSGGGTFKTSGAEFAMLFIFAKATDQQSSSTYVAGDRRYSGVATEDGRTMLDQLSTKYTCPNGDTYQVPSASAFNWFTTETEPTQEVNADGKSIKGGFSRTVEDNMTKNVYTWTWTMKALPPE